jgi:hypothetical protein
MTTTFAISSASTIALAAATRRSDRASSWRRPLRRTSKSFDLRACNARAVGEGGCVGGALPEKRAELLPSGLRVVALRFFQHQSNPLVSPLAALGLCGPDALMGSLRGGVDHR